uniref:Uncharacterized protein n=1 Tax=Toxoplasma gondii COUG TaxID=1074873 RepID=A0A2G8YD48_TOXGO|nr:hypothetical protein TGCOUG_259280 [Toxoplasma gondii COUG]
MTLLSTFNKLTIPKENKWVKKDMRHQYTTNWPADPCNVKISVTEAPEHPSASLAMNKCNAAGNMLNLSASPKAPQLGLPASFSSETGREECVRQHRRPMPGGGGTVQSGRGGSCWRTADGLTANREYSIRCCYQQAAAGAGTALLQVFTTRE